MEIGNLYPLFAHNMVLPDGNAIVGQWQPDGRWLLVVSYPINFHEECQQRLTRYNDKFEEFEENNCQLVGICTESVYSLIEWQKTFQVKFPIISDLNNGMSEALGILSETEKVCQRAAILVNPQGIVKSIYKVDSVITSDAAEMLRILKHHKEPIAEVEAVDKPARLDPTKPHRPPCLICEGIGMLVDPSRRCPDCDGSGTAGTVEGANGKTS